MKINKNKKCIKLQLNLPDRIARPHPHGNWTNQTIEQRWNLGGREYKEKKKKKKKKNGKMGKEKEVGKF